MVHLPIVRDSWEDVAKQSPTEQPDRAEIMPLCQYCDKPQVSSDGVYRIDEQFDAVVGSYVWTIEATSRARSRNDKVNQCSGSEVTRRDS